jgi:hypothetical protein
VSLSAESFDLLAAGLLLLCGVWGFWRGLLSQLVSLAVLLLALVGARWAGPALEQPLGQVLGLASADLPVAAWAVAVGLLLLAGALLAHGLAGLLPARGFPPRASRWLGGLVGLGKGLVLLLLLAYGAVYAAPAEEAAAWRAGSRVLPLVRPLRSVLSQALALPPCTDEVAARVEALAPAAR